MTRMSRARVARRIAAGAAFGGGWPRTSPTRQPSRAAAGSARSPRSPSPSGTVVSKDDGPRRRHVTLEGVQGLYSRVYAAPTDMVTAA
ncbi:hypothetical protein SALBM311S_02662 [Streptomyces alboniger]